MSSQFGSSSDGGSPTDQRQERRVERRVGHEGGTVESQIQIARAAVLPVEIEYVIDVAERFG